MQRGRFTVFPDEPTGAGVFSEEEVNARAGRSASVSSEGFDALSDGEWIRAPEEDWPEIATAIAARTGDGVGELLTYMATVAGTLAGFTPTGTSATIAAIKQVWPPVARVLSRIPGSRRAAGLVRDGDRFISMLGGASTIVSATFLAYQFYQNILTPATSLIMGWTGTTQEEQRVVQESVTKINSIISKEKPQTGGRTNQPQIGAAYIANEEASIIRAREFSTYNVRNNRGTAATRPLMSKERVMFV